METSGAHDKQDTNLSFRRALEVSVHAIDCCNRVWVQVFHRRHRHSALCHHWGVTILHCHGRHLANIVGCYHALRVWHWAGCWHVLHARCLHTRRYGIALDGCWCVHILHSHGRRCLQHGAWDRRHAWRSVLWHGACCTRRHYAVHCAIHWPLQRAGQTRIRHAARAARVGTLVKVCNRGSLLSACTWWNRHLVAQNKSTLTVFQK